MATDERPFEVGDELFCENGSCDVVLYKVSNHGHGIQTNCPGCGQFGRTKDVKA